MQRWSAEAAKSSILLEKANFSKGGQKGSDNEKEDFFTTAKPISQERKSGGPALKEGERDQGKTIISRAKRVAILRREAVEDAV